MPVDRKRALEAIDDIMKAATAEMQQLFNERVAGRSTLPMGELEVEMTALQRSKHLLIYEAGYRARERDAQIEASLGKLK